jgi:aryl-alcohol dehydrogenase-like predicted oxidoreductase
MARDEGMALAPWGVLAGGKIRTDAEEEKRSQTGEKGRVVLSDEWKRTENEKKVCQALEKIAADVGAKSINSSAFQCVRLIHRA